MAPYKNLAITLVATGALIAAIFVMFPANAAAAQVSYISPPTPLDADETFTLDVSIDIPAGEHIPLHYAKVLLAPKGSFLVGGTLDAPFCTAETGGSPAAATVISVTGATASSGTYTGQGYTIAGSDPGQGYSYGYGLSHGASSEAFVGAGTGYGSSSEATSVVVKVQVTGCTIFGTATTPSLETFRTQVFIGSDATHTIPSFPSDAGFANPNYASVGPGTAVASGSGVIIDAGPLAKDVLSAPVSMPTGSGVKTLQIKPLGSDIPMGSTLAIVKDPSLNKDAPSFGVPSLAGQFPTGNPFMQFQVVLTNGSTSTSELNGVLEIHAVIEVPQSYFTGLVPSVFATELDAVNAFKVFGYDSSGNLKPAGNHPATTRLGAATSPYEFDVAITAFSSFAGGSTGVGFPSASPSGGGGGGAIGEEVVTETQTTIPVETVTTTITTTTLEENPDPATSTTEGAGGSGWTVTLWILALLAIAAVVVGIVVRRQT